MDPQYDSSTLHLPWFILMLWVGTMSSRHMLPWQTPHMTLFLPHSGDKCDAIFHMGNAYSLSSPQIIEGDGRLEADYQRTEDRVRYSIHVERLTNLPVFRYTYRSHMVQNGLSPSDTVLVWWHRYNHTTKWWREAFVIINQWKYTVFCDRWEYVVFNNRDFLLSICIDVHFFLYAIWAWVIPSEVLLILLSTRRSWFTLGSFQGWSKQQSVSHWPVPPEPWLRTL